jgi:HPt (histidine-containing phosphotransfer) domain-containing protein
MTDLKPEQRRELDALRRAYAAELPGKVTTIARAAAALDGGAGDGVEELYHLVHRLAGSSAIWGFSAVSKAAGELEEVVLAARQASPALLERRKSEVRRLIGGLQRALRACGSDARAG